MKLILSAIMAFGLATALHAQQIFDYNEPLLKLKEAQTATGKSNLRYSVLTGYIAGAEPIKGQFNSNFMAFIDKEKGTHRISMYNLSIQDMFTHGLWNKACVVLQVKDPSRYHYDTAYGDEQAWLRKNGWCYEIMMPTGVIKGMRIVEEELEKLFNVKSFVEKRNMKVEVKQADGSLKDEMMDVDVLVIRENNL